MKEEKSMHANTLQGAEPLALAQRCIAVLDEKKAEDLRLLHVEEQTVLADYFIICTGTSSTQLRALAAELEYRMQIAGEPPLHMEGYDEANWIIVDFGCVIVHLFTRATRDFYGLEKLWSDADKVDLSALLSAR